jgi:hypothetical protein
MCLSPFFQASLKKNIKHPAEKRKKNFFFLSREKNSFSKSAYSKNLAEKSDIFRKIFFYRKLLPKTRRMSPVGISYDKISSLWLFLKMTIFEGGLLENKILYNFASLPPIPLIFKLETR